MVILILFLLLAHLNLTVFVPAKPGKSWLLWPFDQDTQPTFFRSVNVFNLPSKGGAVTALLAAVAGLGFIGSILSLLGWILPQTWVPALPILASLASILLFLVYFRRWSILPILLNVFVIAFAIILNSGVLDY